MFKEANVTLFVKDMDRAVHFYSDVLGLKLKTRYGSQFAQVEAPGVIIALHPAGGNGPQPRSSESMSIGFAVQNLEESMTELTRKGVRFLRTTDDNQVRLAFFTDADGNPLYLSQSKWVRTSY